MGIKLKTVAAAAFLLALAAFPARAVDISTHSFSSCGFPDTNQSRDYTATFGEDHDYYSSASTMSFTIYNPTGISSVTVDNRTGLMWVTTPSTDAGFGTGQHTWESALTSCTVTLNGMAYGGYTDWRLPSINELASILDYGTGNNIFINARAFPGVVVTRTEYWTSTTYAGDTTRAWYISFSQAVTANGLKTGGIYSVRCVRGGP